MNLGRIAIVAQGSYNLTRTYKKLDTVEFNGSIYVALMAIGEGESPIVQPTKWMLGAKAGKDFKFEDFTSEQIELLQAPANNAIALVDAAIERANTAAQNATPTYNDSLKTLASDIIKRVDINTGEDVNYREVTKWEDGSPMSDEKVDGVIYVKKVKKYYKRQYESSINVKWFGAKGDGENDDTAQIKTAIRFLFSLRTNGIKTPTLKFPKGIYKISETLIFPAETNLKGESQSNTELFFSNQIGNGIVITQTLGVANSHNPNVNYSSFQDISITGFWKNYSPFGEKQQTINNDSNGIVLDKILKFNLTNVSIFGFESAGVFYNDTYYQNINNCFFRNNKIGIFIAGLSTTILCTNSEIRENSIGVRIDNSFANKFVNCIIESNIAHFNPFVELNVAPSNGAGVGVTMNDGANSNTFESCYFEGQILDFHFNTNCYGNIVSKCFLAPSVIEHFDPLTRYLARFDGNSSDNLFINNNHEGNEGTMPLRCGFSPNSKRNSFIMLSKNYYERFLTENSAIINATYADNGLRENAPLLNCESANKKYLLCREFPFNGILACTSVNRPAQATIGMQVLNLDTNKINTFNGTDWVNPDGTFAI